MREYSFSYYGSTYANHISSSYSSGSISLSFFLRNLRSWTIKRRFWVSYAFFPPKKKGSSPSSFVHLAPIPRVSFYLFFILRSSLLEDELEELEELDPSESELDEVPLELLDEFDFFLFFFGGAAAAAFLGWGGFLGAGFFFFLFSSLPEAELEELDEDPEPSFFTFYFKSAGALLSNFFLPFPD
jgi:hypothetical protein